MEQEAPSTVQSLAACVGGFSSWSKDERRDSRIALIYRPRASCRMNGMKWDCLSCDKPEPCDWKRGWTEVGVNVPGLWYPLGLQGWSWTAGADHYISPFFSVNPAEASFFFQQVYCISSSSFHT